MDINSLSPELLVWIFKCLNKEDLLSVKLVCKHWLNLSKSPYLWMHFDCSIRNVGKETTQLKVIQLAFLNRRHVHYLKIRPEWFGKVLHVLGRSQTFEKLTHLHLVPYRIYSSSLFRLINDKCPKVESLSFKCDRMLVLTESLSNIPDLKLKELDIGCDEEAVTANLTGMLTEKFPELSALSISVSTDNEVKLLLEQSRNLRILRGPRSIPFRRTTIHGAAFYNMSTISTLIRIDLDYTDIDDDCLVIISQNAPNLKILSVFGCNGISDRGIHQITSSCKNIEDLRMGRQDTNRGSKLTISAISNNCNLLKDLSAEEADISNQEQLAEITRSCIFHSLDFKGCSEISDSSLMIIAQNCPRLGEANFSYCNKITIHGIWFLMVRCLWLRKLHLESCNGLSEFLTSRDYVKTSEKQHSELRLLDFSMCRSLRAKTVRCLANLFPDLRDLILEECIQMISDENKSILQEIFQDCPFLNKISITPKDIVSRRAN